MKPFFTHLFVLLACLATRPALGQAALSVSATSFAEGEPISFTYNSPDWVSTDWIGIYEAGQTPGDANSTLWDYIPEASGTYVFTDPLAPGSYVAFLLCCDSYDVYATSEVFIVTAGPSLVSQKAVYEEGETLVFDYSSPNWVDTDWIGIFNQGETPGTVGSIVYEYLPQAMGTATFDEALAPGQYTAFLLCCDGYDIYAQVDFAIEESTGSDLLRSAKDEYGSGETITLLYESPSFSPTDWIGIYKLGNDPNVELSQLWQYIPQASGALNFAGSLEAGTYVAYLFCCNSLSVYAMSKPFTVQEGVPGAVLTANASVYPEGSPMIFTYASPVFDPTDWIGIYRQGQTPGDASSLDYQYIPAASGYLTFTTSLAPGQYTAYLLCCDGYTVYASVNFEVGGINTASLVASKLIYTPGEDIVFTFNSPDYSSTDWIGIYASGERPGDASSTEWDYIPAASGQLALPSSDLYEGQWKAYLLCCDGYDVYASAEFTFSLTSSTREPQIQAIQAYPNPTSGQLTLDLPQDVRLRHLEVLDATGRRAYQLAADAHQRALDLSALPNGLYTLLATSVEGQTYAARISLQR